MSEEQDRVAIAALADTISAMSKEQKAALLGVITIARDQGMAIEQIMKAIEIAMPTATPERVEEFLGRARDLADRKVRDAKATMRRRQIRSVPKKR